MDKMGLAALSVTLLHYLKEEALVKIPIWRMIATSLEDLTTRAREWSKVIGHGVAVAESLSTIGGGSLPGETLTSRVLSLTPRAETADDLARRLREGDPPIVGRIDEDRVLLDLRTVLPEEDGLLLQGVSRVLE